MTAIFAVWNRSGFAVAADQSISISGDVEGQEQTFWTEFGSKLLRLDRHSIVVATAGRSTLNGVPLLHIVGRWAEQLHDRPGTVAEYASDFLQWYAAAVIPADWTSDHPIMRRTATILRTLQDDGVSGGRTDLDEVRRLVSEWMDDEPANFMSNPEVGWVHAELSNGPEPDREHYLRALVNSVPSVADSEVRQEISRLAELIEAQFAAEFGTPFDVDESWDVEVRDLLADYFVRYLDDEGSDARLMFIGYGDSEWIPSQVTLSLYQHGGRVPRVLFWGASSPEHVWHVSLGQDDQVLTLLLGASSSYRAAVRAELDSDDFDDVEAQFDSLVDQRLARMRSKINNLSVPKLEFVARSFVELESLGSFLVENLPSVGGEVDVISMTR